jgi:hypothetical protein
VSRPAELPSEVRVAKAADELLHQAEETGTAPSVLALARLFGLSNTTFRRHFPDIAERISDARRKPPTESPARGAAGSYDALVAREAKLRRANRGLTDHLKIAAANIQRLSLENYQLRQALQAVSNVTRIDGKSKRIPPAKS